MATSGNKSYTLLCDEIITVAMRRMRKYVTGQTIPADVIADCRQVLNMMILEWQSLGARIWNRKQLTLFIEPGQRSYSLPGANCCYTSGLITQAVNGAVTSGSGTITVDDDAGITDGMTCIVIVSSSDWFVTTVNGTPAANVVTLTDNTDADIADDSVVYFFDKITYKPLRLEYLMHQNTNGDETWVRADGRNDYLRQTSKDSTGRPVRVYYDSGTTTGTLYVWPVGDVYGERFNLDVMMAFDVFTASTDNADFPQEWINSLAWGLASEMGPEFGIPEQRQQRIDARASASLTAMLGFDRNPAPLRIEFDRSEEHSDEGMSLDGFQ